MRRIEDGDALRYAEIGSNSLALCLRIMEGENQDSVSSLAYCSITAYYQSFMGLSALSTAGRKLSVYEPDDVVIPDNPLALRGFECVDGSLGN